jgi:phosphoglucosamine mutase
VTLRFGTDGVRGPSSELTPQLVAALGRAAARVLGGDRAVIGRDTRRSGPAIEAALHAGFAAEGVGVELLGVVPTPAVAHASAAEGVTGAMISASHNPFDDNGVKLFAAGGLKLTDDVEERLEAELDHLRHEPGAERLFGSHTPERSVSAEKSSSGEGWADSVVASVGADALDGLRLVIDCANGAASTWAPGILSRLGATVEVLHAEPDGTNINQGCGSTHPADVQARVVATGADAGLAFDGDADRVVAVDAGGDLVDGDHLIAICALDRHQRGLLRDDTVVVTVMANLGFRLAMAAHGIHVEETAVGDRYVLEALARGGWSLGGEQSGHVIFPDLATTGDGLLTAVQVLDAVARSGRTLAEAASVVTKLPQVLHNVTVAERRPDVADRLAEPIAEAEARLGPRGRVLVRPSGTESLVRVMVEAEDADQAEAEAQRLVAAVEDLSRAV